MVPLSPNRIAWRYTDDYGNNFAVQAQKAITDQAKTGGIAADGTESALPFGFKMRRVLARSAAGKVRYIVAYASDATILTAGTTINLNYLNDSTVFTTEDHLLREKERLGRKARGST